MRHGSRKAALETVWGWLDAVPTRDPGGSPSLDLGDSSRVQWSGDTLEGDGDTNLIPAACDGRSSTLI